MRSMGSEKPGEKTLSRKCRRKVRTEYAGSLLHHLSWRWSGGDLENDQDGELFLSILGQVSERCGFVVHSYGS
jgi:hypothetical protein